MLRELFGVTQHLFELIQHLFQLIQHMFHDTQHILHVTHYLIQVLSVLNHVVKHMIHMLNNLYHVHSNLDQVIYYLYHVIKHMNHVVSGIMEVMSHPVDPILDVSQRLKDIRERIVALDAERDELEAQLQQCLVQLSSTLEGQRLPPPDGTMSQRVIFVLKQNPDYPMAPMDMARILGIKRHKELTNLRVCMSRMARQGIIGKTARARYVAR